jgi:RNA polymerase sigma factor (sigma-70 family)
MFISVEDNTMLTNETEMIELAAGGDKYAMEAIILDVQDMIYNLSLRILGTLQDAEDASQEIILKIIQGLSRFRRESAFSTWVYRISINYLLNYKKSMFAKAQLSFDYYAEDIQKGFLEVKQELFQEIDENLLAEELKTSCTNVMLQCLNVESRCIYVLGTMFHLDSKIAGEILDLSPEAYRQRLSRIRKTMADFMNTYCGLAKGSCNCKKRIGYAITNHRLVPKQLEYSLLKKLEEEDTEEITKTMEQLDTVALLFASMPQYKNPKTAREFVEHLTNYSIR